MKCAYLICLLSLIIMAGCSCPGDKTAQVKIEDTPQNRYRGALEVVRLYPLDKWGDDILSRVSEKTGPEVAGQLKDNILARMDTKAILELRLKIITEILNPDELRALTTLLDDSAGQDVLRKLYRIDERLTQEIAPELFAILSGKSSVAAH